MQAIAADSVIAYVTHDDRPISVKPARSETTWGLVELLAGQALKHAGDE